MDTASHTSKVQWRAVEDHLTKENKVQEKGVWREEKTPKKLICLAGMFTMSQPAN